LRKGKVLTGVVDKKKEEPIPDYKEKGKSDKKCVETFKSNEGKAIGIVYPKDNEKNPRRGNCSTNERERRRTKRDTGFKRPPGKKKRRGSSSEMPRSLKSETLTAKQKPTFTEQRKR